MPDSAAVLDAAAIQALLDQNFAPWVRDLDLTVTSASGGTVELTMRPSVRLNRQGGIVSGQALAAAADTVMVLSIFSACNDFIPCATVDLHTSFLKPATNVELHVTSSIVRLGRSISVVRADIVSSADGKPVVTATGTYSLPPR